MSQIDWSKAPEGATHCCRYGYSFHDFSNGGHKHWLCGQWVDHKSKFEEYDTPGALVARPWTGEGLPPAGTVCELSERVLLADSYTADWFEAGTQVEIGGHAIFARSTWPVCSICVVGENFTGTISEVCLRHIRTPEQISAEERAAAIEDMWSTYWQPEATSAKQALGLLWDAGYRKTEAK